ncbi:hypothetical protein VCHENC02_1967 [Vibrio harveyi]|uniref:Uncharacterized protein n=1 Tax=Vibrio harveyi TaxID=669 RepID=A0A454D1K0_VIBHA|nr:hypothetical protein VCHENC02_1967 [Vibrio harveyi]
MMNCKFIKRPVASIDSICQIVLQTNRGESHQFERARLNNHVGSEVGKL